MAVVITKSQYTEDQSREIVIDEEDWGHYRVSFDVFTEDDNHWGHEVLLAARTITPGTGLEDKVPGYMEQYKITGVTPSPLNPYAFAKKFKCYLPDPQVGNHWRIEVEYEPLDPVRGSHGGKNNEPNPLLWPIEYRVEWIEEQVPLEEAYCLTDLPSIGRGPTAESAGDGPSGTALGPVVNACGQQTIDPVMVTMYHPVAVAVKNYPTYLDAIRLNALYMDTTNSDTFLEDDPRQWRYLFAESANRQEAYVAGTGWVNYYPTTIKVEFKRATWDKLVLNNGLVCFRIEPGSAPASIWEIPAGEEGAGQKALFPCQVYDLSEWEEGETPTLGTRVPATEPCNLDLEGLQMMNKTSKAKHIQYRHLRDITYADMGATVGGTYAEALF